VALIVVAVILRSARRLRSLPWAVCLGLLLGGALGNLADRLFREPGVLRGRVVDFIDLQWHARSVWPSFNVADASIVVGGLVALVLTARRVDLGGADPAAPASDTEP
jgi:signal peptidase II